MFRRSLMYAVVLACTSVAMLSIGHAQTRAVIELFTSQGCSSCPAADRLMGEFAADPSLVSISLPIDYWDYLGWKDTLADPRHTVRQRAYSKVRGDREVYTPQAVVSGGLQVLGSDRAGIERVIATSHQNPTVLSLPVTIATAGAHLTITLPERGNTPAEIWVVGIAKAVTVAIKRGENKGKTITYSNVARRWIRLDPANSKAWTIPVQDIASEGVNQAAVIVQGGTIERPGPVLGAAMAAIR
jgi:hypothetical protein